VRELDDVRARVARSERVLFLTGAGLSVASGIAPYRKAKDAVWSRFITEWGTIERFHENPLEWWKEFWIKAHGPLAGEGSLDEKLPNAGHVAITELVMRHEQHIVITQNIDGLHRRAGVPEEKLIEIHGRHDRFVCTREACARVLDAMTRVDLAALANGKIPLCDRCQAPLRPLVLLFDETYDSHPMFQMPRAHRALHDAQVIVFVGTSFSVGITDYAIRAGLYARSTLVNVNVEPVHEHGFVNLIGRAEEILPKLSMIP
jgi:NAD-dependent SIR2 family protein deacetylase